MIAAPWGLMLTVVFVYTGVVSTVGLISWLRRPPAERRFDGALLIDVNHILMSAAMIWMSWSMESELALWLQVALFAVLTAFLLLLLPAAQKATQRRDVGGHITLNVSMIWMLAAMPLLMAETAMDHGDIMENAMDARAGGGERAAQMMETPLWADVANIAFAVLGAAVALWWTYRAVASRRHRLHASCHAVMGAGMSAMLVLMN